MPVTSDPFNSAGGYTVGIPPANAFFIAPTGNITAPFANIGNVVAGQGIFGNLTVSGTITGNITGNVSGNIRVPGADTQVLFNIGGNVATSPNFTFNPVTNFLHLMGNMCVSETLCANYLGGDGSNLTNVQANTALTVINGLQPNITWMPNLTDFTVSNSANFASVGVIHIPGGHSGDVLTTNGSGNLSWKKGSHTIANGGSNITIATSGGPIEFNVPTAQPAMTIGTAGNITIETELWVDGNVRAGVFDGNGSRLFDIPAANIVGSVPASQVANYANFAGQAHNANTANLANHANTANVANSSLIANYANYSGNVVLSAQPNITTVGNLLYANVVGNLTAANVHANTRVSISNTVIGTQTVSTSSTAPTVLFTYSATITGGKFTVLARTTVGGSREIVELNMLTDGVGAVLNEFGRVSMGGSLGTQTATVNSGNLEIWVTPSTAAPITWTVNYTLI